jgi:hypothetical protein
LKTIYNNIDAIKHIQSGRLVYFRENDPNMFLSANLDTSNEDIACASSQPMADGASVSNPHMGDKDVEESPSIEVFSKKNSSKRKLVFKSNCSRPYVEPKRS